MLLKDYMSEIARDIGLKTISQNANGKYGVIVEKHLDIDISKWNNFFVMEGKIGSELFKDNSLEYAIKSILKFNLKQIKTNNEIISLDESIGRLILRKYIDQNSLNMQNAMIEWKKFLGSLRFWEDFVSKIIIKSK